MADNQSPHVPSDLKSILIGKNAPLPIGNSVMLAAGTAAVIFASRNYYSGGWSLWFIGFIPISLSGLSMTAAVFRGLKKIWSLTALSARSHGRQSTRSDLQQTEWEGRGGSVDGTKFQAVMKADHVLATGYIAN